MDAFHQFRWLFWRGGWWTVQCTVSFIPPKLWIMCGFIKNCQAKIYIPTQYEINIMNLSLLGVCVTLGYVICGKRPNMCVREVMPLLVLNIDCLRIESNGMSDFDEPHAKQKYFKVDCHAEPFSWIIAETRTHQFSHSSHNLAFFEPGNDSKQRTISMRAPTQTQSCASHAQQLNFSRKTKK